MYTETLWQKEEKDLKKAEMTGADTVKRSSEGGDQGS